MRAALITGRRQLELVEVPDPDPAPDGVVVDIALCGICGTDIHAFQSGEAYRPSLCGHEWTGRLSAVGPDVRRLTEGDTVVVAVPPACGRCGACRAGQTGHCRTVFAAQLGDGVAAADHGGFAPRLAVGAGRVIKADPRLDPVTAAQVEPATVTMHAVRHSGIRLGDIVVVQGAGPIGLLTLQWARRAGAGRVVVVEPDENRRVLAGQLGADRVVAPGEEADQTVADETAGLGADLVYECVGRADTVQTAVDLARRGGRMALIGLAVGLAEIDPTQWLLKEISVTSALAYTHDEFASVMAMMGDGHIDVSPLHTATVSLDELDATLADLADGATGQVKVLVDPSAG